VDAAIGGGGGRGGGFAVYRLNGTFGSHDVTSTPKGAAYDIVPFIPKHVVM
jgi:hypothetical protein